MSSPEPTPVERAIAAAIYVPIGIGAELVDVVKSATLPGGFDRARQHVTFARFIGKMAVDQGVRELRQRVVPSAVEPETSADAVAADPVKPVPMATALSPGALALPDYDQLPAAHIVAKLGGLTTNEIDAIETYELAHRHRRTVLGKISQLRND